MCTVSWMRQDGGYRLFCNHDEKHTRDAVVRDPADGLDVADLRLPHGASWQSASDIRARRFASFVVGPLKFHWQRIQSAQDETRTPTQRLRRAFQAQVGHLSEKCVDGDLRLQSRQDAPRQ